MEKNVSVAHGNAFRSCPYFLFTIDPGALPLNPFLYESQSGYPSMTSIMSSV